MLTGSPSDDPRAQPLGAKRIRIEDPPSTKVSDKTIPPTLGKTERFHSLKIAYWDSFDIYII